MKIILNLFIVTAFFTLFSEEPMPQTTFSNEASIEWVKLTPLDLAEIFDIPTSDRTSFFKYIEDKFAVEFLVKDIKDNETYTLNSVDLRQNISMDAKVRVDKTGQTIWEASPSEYQERCITFLTGFMKGEPTHRILQREEDNAILSSITIYPNPNEVVGKDGRRLELKMQDPKAEVFMLEISGMTPNSEGKAISTSCNETIDGNIMFSDKGKALLPLRPAVINKVGGKASVTIIDIASGHSLTLHYNWGKAALKI